MKRVCFLNAQTRMKLSVLTIVFMLGAVIVSAQTQPVKQSTKETAPTQSGVVVKQSNPATSAEKAPANQSKDAAPKVTPQKQPSKTTTPTTKPKVVTPVNPNKASDVAPTNVPTTTTKDITGYWLTANKGTIVQFYKDGDSYHGKAVWHRQANDKNGKPLKDINNPDKSKRNNPLMGSLLVTNLKYNPKTKMYEGGKVYQPNTGRTFDCKVKLIRENNVMEITGTAGMSMISKTLTWSRTTGVPGQK
ncbi:MAG: hypothetical protein CVT94_04785 [Bacteroidetes bacterium HGW-Bacteroidetes-11]|nr:MAG: hypothetical protein CVT94_04785 [Bacteroidetes bacterium HGW-Bacteroidetes-11]